ncbi:MAG: Asp23/Gls24 family envelope stress response protein [Oscillospiraceae bacterium]|nr:Asp23/Gls24 family envelope stress response protein [Oscillospiraceae bacterium]
MAHLGTGKSYRAQMVASERGIQYIIDDGLLVKGNEVIAGVSAKRAPTKIETVKKALYQNPEEANIIKKALRKDKAENIMLLGTSDNMVKKIAENLGLPAISETIYIADVATEDEMAEAKRTRMTEGKHVIPVPTFEIKKDFSGYLLDPLQIFKTKGKDVKPYIAEKSIIRPTFSYLGNYTISDTVFRQIIEYLANKVDAIHKIHRVRIDKLTEGMYIYIEIIVNYGHNVVDTLTEFKKKLKKEIENLTAMNVEKVSVVAKSLHVPDELRTQ